MFERCLRVIFSAVLFLCPILLGSSCAVNPVSGQRQLMLLSEADEIKLGRQTDAQVIGQYGIYDDAELTRYVSNFCQKLGTLSHRASLPYQCKILDAPVVNAFAVPGGYVYFTRGILASLNSEAELAGVMGHEIGHIAARHSAQQYSKAQFAQLGLGLGMIFSDTFRSLADAAQFGVGMLFMRFSRDNERQADDLGVEYSTRAGYDATQMAHFFETLERMRPGSDRSGLPSWFSTHPNPVDRIGMVKQRASQWQQQLGVSRLKINREQYLRKIDGLVFGEDPREGFVENSVFYHPALRLQFPVPPNWNLKNTRTLVQMTSEQKDAAILFAISSARFPKQAAQEFVNKSKAVVTESSHSTLNGLPAYRLASQHRSPKGLVRALSYFIEKDKKVYVFHGMCPAKRFEVYGATFEGTMRGFRKLADPSKLSVKPDRIRIRATRTAGTLRQALRSLGVPVNKFEEFALLNGKRLDDHLPANTLLKLVKKERQE